MARKATTPAPAPARGGRRAAAPARGGRRAAGGGSAAASTASKS